MRRGLSCILAILTLVAMLTVGCTAKAPATEAASGAPAAPAAPAAEKKDLTFVWACQYNSLPMFVNTDYVGMDLAEEELGVTIKKIGPQEIDMPAMIAAIEQEIASKPDGMMVVGWDSALAAAINKVYDAGIPVITIDADVPNSKRVCFVGVDTRDAGCEQARQAAPYLEGKSGKVVCFGVAGSEAHMLELQGYTATMASLNPNIEVDQTLYPSESNSQKVAEKVKNIIQSDPSVIAFAGFDSTCGPGIATAIQEAGKVGEIIGTCSDGELEHLQGVKSGALVACVGYKRHFNTYYGAKMLYDYLNTPVKFTNDDAGLGITPIPASINIGYIIGTPSNVDALIAEAQAKAK